MRNRFFSKCFDITFFVDRIKPEDTRDDVRDDGKNGTTTDENKEGTFDYEGMPNPHK